MSANIAAPVVRGAPAPLPGQTHLDIMRHPRFQELVAARTRFGWVLSAVTLFFYLGFILLVAFDKQLLAQKVGVTTSLGIVLGLAVIIAAFLLTGLYVARANGRYDDLTAALKREVGL